MAPEGAATHRPRRPARAPLSPVAPRRTAVTAVLRPADHGLPCRASLIIGASYGSRLPAERDGSPVWVRRAPASPICTHGSWLQRGFSEGSRRARRASNPCKSTVDRVGFEPATSAAHPHVPWHEVLPSSRPLSRPGVSLRPPGRVVRAGRVRHLPHLRAVGLGDVENTVYQPRP